MEGEQRNAGENEFKKVQLSEKTLHLDERGSAASEKSIPRRTKLGTVLVREVEGANGIIDAITQMDETLSREKRALLVRNKIAERHRDEEMTIGSATCLLKRTLDNKREKKKEEISSPASESRDDQKKELK